MKCTIYVEGGGDRDDLRSKARQGFSKLLGRAGFKRPLKPAIRAHGGRSETFKAFCRAWSLKAEGDIVLLLVDAECPVDAGAGKWRHLKECSGDGWSPPPGVDEDNVFLMVQVMETWLIADRETVADYSGQGFRSNSLPRATNLEEVTKERIFEAIASATRQCRAKGPYGKGAHSFELIGLVDPGKIESLPHGREFFDSLRRRLGRTP